MFRKSLVFCLGGVLLAGFAATVRAENYAVVVGVDQYTDFRNIPELRYCVDDAELIYQKLTQHCGYERTNVLLLTHKERVHLHPTRDNLREQIPAWLANARENDTVLVFFSGHGFLAEGKADQAVLATQDCGYERLLETGLPTQELKQWLLDCRAKRKFLILDCCHAGTGGLKGDADAKSKALGEQFGEQAELAELNRLAYEQAAGLVTLASCTQEQQSLEWSDEQHGLFTYFLAKGLSGLADTDRDGVVDHMELFHYTMPRVSRQARKAMNADQTPVLFHHASARGFFPLAHVEIQTPLFVTSPGPNAASVATKRLPPPPDARAEQAFAMLQSKGGDAPQRLAAAKTLVEEAETLRVAESDGKSPAVDVTNPFFNAERAETVFQWLDAAEKEFTSDRQPGVEAPESLKVSLALASWYALERQPERAAKLASELYPFESEAARGVQGQLLSIFAKTRDAAPEARRLALESYDRLLELIENDETRTGLSAQPKAKYEEVIRPALALAEELAGEMDPTRAARFHAAYARLIDRRQLFSDAKTEALESYRRALALDPENAEYLLGKASVLLQMADPDFASVRSELQAVLARAGLSPADEVIAHRLAGDTLLRESSETPHSTADRIEKIEAAIESYTQAIEAAKGDGQVSPEQAELVKRHFADSLLSRSAANLALGNLMVASDRERGRLYELARQDARKVAELDDPDAYKAWLALGNAYEDLASQADVTDLNGENTWRLAESAFREAQKERSDKAEPFISMGRCYLKRHDHLRRQGKEEDFLEQAQTELEYSLFLNDRLPEAKYWLAQVDLARYDVESAERRMGEVVELLEDPQLRRDVSEQDLAAYYEGWAKLALQRVGDSAGVKGGTKVSAHDVVFRTQQLTRFDPAKAAALRAQAYWKEGSLEAARRNYDTALEEVAKKPAAPPDQQIELLLGRSELVLFGTDPGGKFLLWEQDRQRAKPKALADAERAASLAGESDKHRRAMARYLAAVVHENLAFREARDTTRSLAERKRLYLSHLATAGELLQGAIADSPDHPRSWRFREMYATRVVKRQVVHETDRQKAAAMKQEAVRRMNEAIERCKEAERKANLERVKADLMREWRLTPSAG